MTEQVKPRFVEFISAKDKRRVWVAPSLVEMVYGDESEGETRVRMSESWVVVKGEPADVLRRLQEG